jgi:hypothetical protein
MKIPQLLTAIAAAAFTATAGFSQSTSSSPAAAAAANAGQPGDAEMMKQMMEMSKTNENHKLLADLDGNWNYTVKFWMDPSGKPQEFKGIATRKSIMDGRYFIEDVSGKVQMPDASGKVKDMEFKGMGVEAYDNAKKKFVASWMDNMSTGILMSEGTYDASSKSFTFTGEYEPLPGMKQKIREVLTVTDKDHMNFEWFEDRGGKEAKTMELNYTRKK